MGPSKATDVVVIGGGVAGSAIAYELSMVGKNVTVLFPQYDEGSSYTNQKWLHSGLLYPHKRLAKLAWDEFANPHGLIREFMCRPEQPSRFLALKDKTLDERERLWRDWDVASWGLTWRRLSRDDIGQIGYLINIPAVGGFEVPDVVIDFPALIRELHRGVARSGDILIGARVNQILTDVGRTHVSE